MGLLKRFGKLVAIDGISLEVEEGECPGLVGPNGAGKSTLICAIAGRTILMRARCPSSCRILGMTGPAQARSISPEDVLQHMRVEDGLYVIGCLERRVTLYSQQIRALNLVYSLRERKVVRPDETILIVGGGVAGLTAAAGAFRLGFKVILLEQRDELLHVQRGCTKRWIHPHIYDWPAAGSTDETAAVPLLPWKAAMAGKVAEQILTAFERRLQGGG